MDSRPGSSRAADPFASFRDEHRGVLAELDELERRTLGGTGVADEAVLRVRLERLTGRFAAHIAAEDAVLYPAILGVFPAGRPTLTALGADHDELRQMLATLGRALAAPASEGRDEQLRVVLRDFIDLLRLHVHREESAVFDVASRVLTNPEAEALAARLLRLADSPGPGAGPAPGQSKGTP